MNLQTANNQLVVVLTRSQLMHCYENDELCHIFPVSTAKNGLGEKRGSECTPRGWHQVHSVIGLDNVVNSVFVGRVFTGEIYCNQLAFDYPERDWILTRIIRIEGLEPGRNRGGEVDTLERFIYLHGVPDVTPMGVPGSHGCIRMRNTDVMSMADWIKVGARICIE